MTAIATAQQPCKFDAVAVGDAIELAIRFFHAAPGETAARAAATKPGTAERQDHLAEALLLRWLSLALTQRMDADGLSWSLNEPEIRLSEE